MFDGTSCADVTARFSQDGNRKGYASRATLPRPPYIQHTIRCPSSRPIGLNRFGRIDEKGEGCSDLGSAGCDRVERIEVLTWYSLKLDVDPKVG